MSGGRGEKGEEGKEGGGGRDTQSYYFSSKEA